MKLYSFVIALFLVSGGFSQARYSKYLNYQLGFKISATAGTQMVSYAILAIDTGRNNKIVKTTFITETQYIMYGKGILKSVVNPRKINLFEEFGADCGLILSEPYPRKDGPGMVTDTLWEEMKPLCLPIYDIWKLKYGVNPQWPSTATNIPEEDMGWAATKFRPSYRQNLMLQLYGVSSVDDWFHGSGMFRLLRDIQQDEWIETYKGLLD